LFRVADGIRRGLHARVDLALEADLRAIVDARAADEEADLLGRNVRKRLRVVSMSRWRRSFATRSDAFSAVRSCPRVSKKM
jgi:hypothetical protein